MVHLATNSFIHRCKCSAKAVIFLLPFIVLIGACGKKAKDIHDFGDMIDVTETVHHRLKAGMFDASTDPFVFEVIEKIHLRNISELSRRLPSELKKGPRQLVRVSWDRGTFRVQSDDKGRVVIYMDEETLLSHVQVSTLKKFNHSIQFREVSFKPYR